MKAMAGRPPYPRRRYPRELRCRLRVPTLTGNRVGIGKRQVPVIRSDGPALVGEIFGERVSRQSTEAGDDGFRVDDGTCHIGMGVGVSKEAVDGFRPHGIITAGDDFIKIDKANMLFRGYLLSPAR